MTIELSNRIVKALEQLYPDASCSLDYDGDPWKLLVMSRLSAQCTDARVNIVSRELFKKYPDVYAMAGSTIGEIEEQIKSCGLYHMKAKDLFLMSQMLIEKFDGRVPQNMEDLLLLPGVGRKIANLMMGDCFGEPSIVTDTHCIRICGRLGYYPEKEKNPKKIEQILCKKIPKGEQSDFCHRLVLFGRETCIARGPRCDDCPLGDLCKRKGKTK